MRNLRSVPVLAVVLLVALRMSIGWQFFYEGVWKLKTLSTARPWSAAGYLKNSQGPLRPVFREMGGDPDDLDWLDYDKVAAKWDDWSAQFQSHYELNEEQQKRLGLLLDGPEQYAAELEQLPEGVEIRGSLAKAVSFNADRKRLIVDGKLHLTPRERDRLMKMVDVVEGPADDDRERNAQAQAFQDAVQKVYARASRLSFKDRLAASLKGDPERVGLIDETQEGTIDYKRLGEIELYEAQLERYAANRAKVEQAFQHDHTKQQWGELQAARVQVAGPVKALDAEFKEAAHKLLTIEQLASGPVSSPWQRIDLINLSTIWGLVVLGLLLIAGLFSRLAALGAAVLLLSFYLAMPPWPGVVDFQELPGPEHSYLVDKNMIEVCALLAIACLPTGQWFGLDALIRGFKARRRSPAASPEAAPGKKVASAGTGT